MKKVLFLLLILIFPFSVWAGKIGDNLEYAGYLETKFWIKNNNDNGHQFLSSFKNTIDLRMEYKMSDNWFFFFHPRYFYDFAYSIRDDANFDKNQAKMGHTQRTEWLRDCYLDYISPVLDVRLGKQQVAWSQADGLPFILDRVMPFDLSYYWLPDFSDIRIPLWMAKVEYSPWLNSTLQFLFIPDFEASRSGPANSPFAFKSVNAFDTVKSIMEAKGGSMSTDVYRPTKDFKNSRIGLRWRSFLSDWEYTLNWLYGYSTSAYTYRDGVTRTGGSGSIPALGYMPIGDYRYSRRHKIIQVIGGGFNRSFNNPGLLEGVTLKGEFAYIHDEPTYYGTKGSRQLTEQTDKYNWFIGLDKKLFTNWTFSTQFAQLIADHDTKKGYHMLSGYTYGLMEKVESVVTFKVSTDFFYERLKPELMIIWGDDNDGRAKIQAQYEVNENLWFTLGYWHFWGSPYGSNGMYRNNDHTYCSIKYTF